MSDDSAEARHPTFSDSTRSPFAVTMAWMRRTWPEGAAVVQDYVGFLRSETGNYADPPRRPLPVAVKSRRRPTYSDALKELEAERPELARVVSAYVRDLRGECAEYRVRLKEAEKDVAYLEGRLDAVEVVAGE